MKHRFFAIIVTGAACLSFVAILLVLLGSVPYGSSVLTFHLTDLRLVALMLGTSLFIASIAVAILTFSSGRRERRIRVSDGSAVAAETGVVDKTAPTVSEAPHRPEETPQARAAEKNVYNEAMIARLLEGDERRVYEMVASAGGGMLQMKIISGTGFSKAKVTRLLDKLERRGLVVRERHGLSNLVKIVK